MPRLPSSLSAGLMRSGRFLFNNALPASVFAYLALRQVLVLGPFYWHLLILRDSPLMIPLSAPALWLGLAVKTMGTLVFALVALLFLIRRQPARYFPGFLPSLVALLGWLSPMALILLGGERALDPVRHLWADGLALMGSLGTLWALIHLGRSFSILPAARRIVTTGPYRWVRHPMYVAEAFLLLGIALGFDDGRAVALLIAGVAVQYPRLCFEERELRAHLGADYESYAARVGRLWPRWGKAGAAAEGTSGGASHPQKP